MTPAKLEMMSHKGIEAWLRKELRKRNISHFLHEQWTERSDASLQISPSLHIQIGDGYYSVVSTNEAVEKNIDKVAFFFEDGKGKLEKEIKNAIAGFPVGMVELRYADPS